MPFHCCDNVADFWARPWSRDGSRRAILSRRSGIEMKQLSAKVDAGQCQRWVHVWTTPALQEESDVRLAVAQTEPLRLAIVAGYERDEERFGWQDSEEGPLKRRLSEVAVEIVVAAERNYRQSRMRQFEWWVQRKAQLEDELRQRQLERKRQEQERQSALEQARIDRLLD